MGHGRPFNRRWVHGEPARHRACRLWAVMDPARHHGGHAGPEPSSQGPWGTLPIIILAIGVPAHCHWGIGEVSRPHQGGGQAAHPRWSREGGEPSHLDNR